MRRTATHRDDATGLTEHVIQRRGHRAAVHAVRIRRSPRDLHGVDIWVGGDKRDDGVVDPVGRVLVERVQRDEQRERPDLKREHGDGAAVDDLAEIAEDEEGDNAERDGRHAEKVRLRGVEAELTQRKREVSLRWGRRHWRKVSGKTRVRHVTTYSGT